MAQYLESLVYPPAPEDRLPLQRPSVPAASAADTSWLDAEVEVSIATYQAYQILYYAFTALLAVAGLDKFLHLLAPWETYVSPAMITFLHMSPGAITVFAGVVELAVAAVVALKPRIGSWAATIWLWLVVINLLTMSGHYDMAISDLALSAAGFAFIRLSAECN